MDMSQVRDMSLFRDMIRGMRLVLHIILVRV